MLENYALGSELAKNGGFNIANISMVIKNPNMEEGVDYLKFGGITLLSTKSNNIPKYIKKVMDKGYTDLSNYIPYSYFKDILENYQNNLSDFYQEVKVDGKRFIELTDPLLKNIFLDESKIKYIVSNKEVPELNKDNLIEGAYKLNDKKSLVWY